MSQQEAAQHLQSASTEIGYASNKAEAIHQNNNELKILMNGLISALEAADTEIIRPVNRMARSMFEGETDSFMVVMTHLEAAKDSLLATGIQFEALIPEDLMNMAASTNSAYTTVQSPIMLRYLSIIDPITNQKFKELNQTVYEYRSDLVGTRATSTHNANDAKKHAHNAQSAIKKYLAE